MGVKQKNVTNVYQRQKIMTASAEELTLMLYNGCIQRIKLAISATKAENIAKSHNNILKAQAIIRELRSSLDMDYEIAQEMADLYDQILAILIEANIKKDQQQLELALELVAEFRQTWMLLMEMKKEGKLTNVI